MKFVKKPVIVEAIQILRENDNELIAWLTEHRVEFEIVDDHTLRMTTEQGQKVDARPGEWIILDRSPGRAYPCDPEVFAATYESAENDRQFRPGYILNRHATEEEMRAAVEQLWQEFWIPIFENADVMHPTAEKPQNSWIDFVAAVKSELFDAHMYAHNLSTVYDDLSGGRVSKPNTDPQVVIDLVEERRQELIGQEIVDWLETKADDHDHLVIQSLTKEAKKEYDVS